MEKSDLNQWLLQNWVGKICELLTSKQYDAKDFIVKFFRSDTGYKILNNTPPDDKTSPSYYFSMFEKECEEKDASLKTGRKEFKDAVFWLSYSLAEWYFKDKDEFFDCLPRIDMEYMLNPGCYDVLHTLSTKRLIDEIKEEYLD